MAKISEVFNQPGAIFVLLNEGQKFPPFENEWQKKPHTFAVATAHEGNVGVLAGNGFIGLDQDDPSAFEGLELPITTTWETRPGRLGMWLKCNDRTPEVLAKYGKKADQAQLKLFKDGEPCGEVKLERTYQIIPPAWKTLNDGSRADYRLLQEIAPAEISLEKLLHNLQALGITFSEKPKVSRLEENAAKLEGIAKEDRNRRAETDEQKTRRYAEAALRGEVEKVRNAPVGNRNNQLNESAFALGQFVAAGILSKQDVISELSRAASYAGLWWAEIDGTIRSGLEAGARNPRELPAPEPDEKADGSRQKVEEASSEIHAKALEILKNGDPIKFIADSCGKMVLGADKAFRKLICCVAVQGVKQSSGLHPKLNGESGSGKTWLVMTFAHHIPPEMVVKGSSSNLAAFYHQDGDRVFRILDDYQAGNETLDTIIKQTSSVFHQKYDHRTVKKQEPLTLHIGSEQTWAITSVDGCQDIQVLNRQIPINVDDSEDLTRKVNARTIERYGKGEEQFPEDEAVQISREIWGVLRADGLINVRIPFYERIDWLDVTNRRNPSLFMDLLVAHTAMNRYRRGKDAEGYYLATEADFHAAKALFTDKDGEELVKRLTTRERDVIGLLLANPSGLTRDDIAKKLNIAPQRVSQIISGQKGAGGLMQKVQIAETRISDMTQINEEQRRTIHKTVYSLEDYDSFTGFDGVVRLREGPRKPRKDDESIDESKPIESSNASESKESKKKKEREDLLSSSSFSLENSSSLKIEKNTFVAFVEPHDSEKAAFVELSGSFPRKHPHVCALCGADLTGMSTVEKNGKIYCALPGCGYPARSSGEVVS